MSSKFIFRATPLAIITAFAVTVVMAQPAGDTNIVSHLGDLNVANVEYKSAFSDYVPYSELKIESWRQANDTVGEIGGWRTYAKEARLQNASAGQPQLDTSSLEKPDSKEVK